MTAWDYAPGAAVLAIATAPPLVVSGVITTLPPASPRGWPGRGGSDRPAPGHPPQAPPVARQPMTPTVLPALKRGDTWTLAMAVNRSTPGGSSVDLTGCARRIAGAPPTHRCRGGHAGQPRHRAPDRHRDYCFSPATTAVVPVGTYLTDLQLTFADGEVRSSQTLTLAVRRYYTRS